MKLNWNEITLRNCTWIYVVPPLNKASLIQMSLNSVHVFGCDCIIYRRIDEVPNALKLKQDLASLDYQANMFSLKAKKL